MYLKKLSKNINFKSKIVKAKIIEVKGSSPNSLDDIILISTDTIFGTIGGGNLEYLVIDEAKKLIDKNIAIFLSINFFASSITKYSKFPPPIVPKIVSVEINIMSSKLLGDDPLTSIILALTILLLKFIFLLNFLRYILVQTF